MLRRCTARWRAYAGVWCTMSSRFGALMLLKHNDAHVVDAYV